MWFFDCSNRGRQQIHDTLMGFKKNELGRFYKHSTPSEF